MVSFHTAYTLIFFLFVFLTHTEGLSLHFLQARRSRPLSSSSLALSKDNQAEGGYGRTDEIFESQFKATKTYDEVYGTSRWKGQPYNKVTVGETDRGKVMRDFDKARVSFLVDSVLVIAVGFAFVWGFGTLKDVKSYGIGSVLGLMYALLLGRYVEQIGTDGSRGGGGGSARFAPVILLIALYGKFKTELHIVPELLGFFTYQVSSFLQAFNDDLYRDKESGK
jgi:hypothetical protein